MIGAGGHLVADARGGIILSGDFGLSLLRIAARESGGLIWKQVGKSCQISYSRVQFFRYSLMYAGLYHKVCFALVQKTAKGHTWQLTGS